MIENSDNKKKRYFQIDVLRGIAMILVVCAHMDWFVIRRVHVFDEVLMDSDMPVFFLISGFFAFTRTLSKSRFLEKFLNLLMSVLYPSVLFFLLYMLTMRVSIVEQIIEPMKLGYWFTFVLFEISIVYLCLLYVAVKISFLNKHLFGVHVAILIGSFLLIKLCGDGLSSQLWFNALSVGLVLRYFPFFIIGAICRIHFETFKKICSPFILGLLCLLWIAGILMRFINIDGVPMSMSVYRFAPMAGAVMFFFLCVDYIPESSEGTFTSRALCYIGKNTLQIYLLHYFFIAGIIAISGDALANLPLELQILVYPIGAFILLVGPLCVMKVLRLLRIEDFVFPKRGIFMKLLKWKLD